MTVCIPNISGPARRQRLVGGIIGVAAAIAVLLAVERLGLPRPWRLMSFPPLLLGAIGLLQAQRSTCIALAATGRRDLNGARDTVTDAAARAQIARQSAGVLRDAVLASLVIAGLTQLD
ncbi:MAG: hypothetical protein HOP12_02780 [Candidatus Eisenbacteria bacterium]|uniref:Uncharacterized protein n=1 Tax=Eiseniibacteriota bacterium TaxID=2212470 RepID=A0A849SMH1_UNCEI|nr:hypothetical protein [Candidatus Eisenbacteria bacterium]